MLARAGEGPHHLDRYVMSDEGPFSAIRFNGGLTLGPSRGRGGPRLATPPPPAAVATTAAFWPLLLSRPWRQSLRALFPIRQK